MAENNFEKQVKDTMHPFGLAPSPGTWEAIEVRIRKERKRRFIFWITFSILIVGAGLSFLLISNKHTTNPPRTAIMNDKSIEANQKNITIPATSATNENKNQKIISVPVSDPAQGVKLVPGKTEHQKNISLANKKEPITHYPQKPVDANQPVEKISMEKVTEKVQATNEVKSNITSTGIKNTGDKEIATSKTTEEKKGSPTMVSTDTVAAMVSPAAKIKPPAKKSPWSLAVSMGRSNISRGLQLFGAKMEAMSFPTNTPFTSSRSTNLRPGFSFTAGIIHTSAINSRLNLHAGFHYQFLSTRMNAGYRVDSPAVINNYYSNNLGINSYYRPSPTGDGSANYLNQYHFAGISLDLSWKIFDGKKFNANWNNGLSYDRLIASNMLHYDDAARFFYKDNNLLRRGQLFYSTSLEIPVSKKLSVSPFASYGLTHVFKGSDSAFHYTNYGIQLRLRLGNKKNNVQR